MRVQQFFSGGNASSIKNIKDARMCNMFIRDAIYDRREQHVSKSIIEMNERELVQYFNSKPKR